MSTSPVPSRPGPRPQWTLEAYELGPRSPAGAPTRSRRVRVLAPFPGTGSIGAGRADDEVARPGSVGWLDHFGASRGVRAEELADWYEGMASALRAGLSEAAAIELGAALATTPRFRGVLAGLHLLLGRGWELSRAMGEFPGVFPPVALALVRAAECAGTDRKAAVFAELARRLARESRLARKLAGALAYPAVVVALSLVVSAVLYLKALPPLVQTFADLGARLPIVTRVLHQSATAVVAHAPIALTIGLGLAALGLAGVWRARRWRWVQDALLRLPVVGEILQYLAVARGLQAFAMLKDAGAADAVVFRLAGAAAGQPPVGDWFAGALARVERGASYDEAFLAERRRMGALGLRVAARLKVAGRSGETAAQLRLIADELLERADLRLQLLPQAIEVPLILLCGGLVGTIVAAIFLPYPSLLIDLLKQP